MHANKMLKTNRCFWQICLKLTTSTNIQKVAKNDPVLGCLRSGMGISRGRGWTQLSPTCPPPVLFLSWGQGPGGHGDHPLVPLIPQSSPSQRGVNMVRCLVRCCFPQSKPDGGIDDDGNDDVVDDTDHCCTLIIIIIIIIIWEPVSPGGIGTPSVRSRTRIFSSLPTLSGRDHHFDPTGGINW